MTKLSGRVRLRLAELDFVMKAGEAAEFDTRTPHWCGTPRRWDTRRRGHAGPLPARGHHGSPAPPHSHRGARRLRHPAGPSGHGLASRRTAPAAAAIRRTAIVRGSGRSRPEPPRQPRRIGDHHLPGAGWAVTTCEQASSRPQALGAYWGHGPDHRDNPRRDPRHMACRRGCGRDRCHAQDVSPHRADRDGRLHRRVACGQAPSPQLARRSRRGQRQEYRSAPPPADRIERTVPLQNGALLAHGLRSAGCWRP